MPPNLSFDFVGGFLTSQTMGLGTLLAQTTTYVRQAGTNLVVASVDPLGRRTEYLYDANGNTTRITRLAGTTQAIAENFSYESIFSEVTSRTDPLGKTTLFAYDTQGATTRFSND